VKLIFITVCGVCGVLLLAYAGQAAILTIEGRPISHAQEDVLDCMIVIVPIVASWIGYQLDWWAGQPARWRGDK